MVTRVMAAAVKGEEVDRAVVHEDAASLFSDYDHKVRHFDVIAHDGDR